ncbi:MAG: hypothetical protein WB462_13600 [Solirubrobacterales bacterium]
MEKFQRWGRGRLAGLLVTLAALLLPASASAADTVYWASESAGTIQYGNLDGTGSVQTLFSGEGAPCGVATNPAAGKIYWANFSGNQIRAGDLAGTSATTLISADHPCGVAVDPAAGKIYWAEFVGVGTTAGTIRRANLNGSNPETLVTGQFGPSGVAIDPALNKIYWTNQDPGGPNGAVWSANLNGSNPLAIVPGQANPIGVAIDAAAGKIYWANLGSCCSGPGEIRSAGLNGSNPVTLVDQSTAGAAGVAGPAGVALDPGANKLYWANFGGGTIWNSSLTGAQPAQLDNFGVGFANFPVLLKKPVSNPEISGGAKVGKELTCRPNFAPDLLGAFLYRAPATVQYQWSTGAVTETITPTSAGDYTCTVTATNQAGTTVKTSAVKKVKAK